MKDHEFYHQLLGLEKPWCVEEVKLDISKQEVEVVVGCQDQNSDLSKTPLLVKKQSQAKFPGTVVI